MAVHNCDPMRIPQRFQYKTEHGGAWKNGVCIPMVSADVEYWSIRAEKGFSSFDEDPWEQMGAVVGDVPSFRWLDNDYGWFPFGGICCKTKYETSEDLLSHLKLCHSPNEKELSE